MNVATEKLSTRFCVKVVSSEAIIMVLFSSSYFNASPVQSFLIRDFCSRHVCAEGKNMLRLPEVVGAKRQMLVATYNDVYAKKIASKLPSPSRLLSNLVPVSHIFHLEGHFGFSPLIAFQCGMLRTFFFLELL